MKKFLCLLVAAIVSVTIVFGGCSLFDSNPNEYNVIVNNSFTSMTDEQWAEYMDNLTPQSGNSMQAAISGSLMSGVSVLTRFAYNDVNGYTYSNFGGFGKSGYRSVGYPTYHKIYCGAGVIVQLDKAKGDAYIITNCHVVYDDTSSSVISDEVYLYLYGGDTEGINYNIEAKALTSDGRDVYYYSSETGRYENLPDYSITDDENFRIKSTVIGASVNYDIALLKVSGSEIIKNSGAIAAAFAEGDDVYVGEQVYAVGNPEGDGMSATGGVISKDSEVIELKISERKDGEYIQYRVIRTDAAINGGNSGGGMYNSAGKLVGIVNSKSVSEEIDNMGYALPGSIVKRLWVLMKEDYESSQSSFKKNSPSVYIAIFPAETKVASAASFINTLGMAEISETIIVDKAGGGLNAGDVIKSIEIRDKLGNVVEKKDITRNYHLDDIMISAREDYTVKVTVLREMQTVDVNLQYEFEKR